MRLDQLRRGDLVVVLDEGVDGGDDNPRLPDARLFAEEVTEELAWLLGAIVGDGTVTYGSGRPKDVRVAAFGEFAIRTAAAFKRVWGVRARPHPTHGLIVSSVGVARTLDRLGLWRRGADKRVPEVVWRWSRRLRLAFCAGYAAADGSVGRDGLAYHSCSRRLIDEVRQIHLEAGHRVTKASPHDNLDAPGIATPRCVARGPGRSSSGGLHGKFMPGTRLVSDADSPGSWRVSAR